MTAIHVGDIGTVFEIELTDETGAALDVSAASVMQIEFEKPNKTKITKTAQHSTDGTDGKIRYVSVAGDIDQPKTWRLQAKVTLPTGAWSSTIGTFTVNKTL